jgi:hypothetical protein
MMIGIPPVTGRDSEPGVEARLHWLLRSACRGGAVATPGLPGRDLGSQVGADDDFQAPTGSANPDAIASPPAAETPAARQRFGGPGDPGIVHGRG